MTRGIIAMELTHVYVASATGIALVLSMAASNKMVLKNKQADYRMFKAMLIIVGFACFSDVLIFTIDGKPGFFFRFINILGNTFAYLATIWVCMLWDAFTLFHLYGDTYKTKRKLKLLSVPAVILSIVSFINCFVPLLFTIGEDNVYSRTPLAYAYSVLSVSYILYSVYIHATFKHKNNVRFFPIESFFLPVLIGYFAQTFFYGLATGWVSVAVGLCNAFMNIQKESAYVDSLTGLLNRAYLFNSKLYESMHGGIMLDINRFKEINDTYGHNVGDQALREVASILFEASNEHGMAVRYAGDEFLVFVEEGGDNALVDIKKKIIEGLDKLNSMPGRNYQLSLSFGLGEYDSANETFDEFMQKLDKNMYFDKEQYYLSHKELSRRRSKR